MYRHPLHFTFHGLSLSNRRQHQKRLYASYVEVCRSICLPPNQEKYCLLVPIMPYVNLVTSVAVSKLNSCSIDTRTPRRRIYFPDLSPIQRRRLSSPSVEDKTVRLEPEPVVSDPTQPRWFGCIHRQNNPRLHFPCAVLAGPQWSSASAA